MGLGYLCWTSNCCSGLGYVAVGLRYVVVGSNIHYTVLPSAQDIYFFDSYSTVYVVFILIQYILSGTTVEYLIERLSCQT